MNRTCYEIFDKLKNGIELTRDDYTELLKMGAPLSLVPEKHRNGRVLEAAFANPKNLKFFDTKTLTTGQLTALLSYQHDFIKEIPEESLTMPMCVVACRIDPELMEFVPERFKNREFFEQLVDRGLSLGFIPEEYRDRELCLRAVSYYDAFVATYSMKYVPDSIKDYDFCLEAVRKHGDNLIGVPKEIQDQDMIRSMRGGIRAGGYIRPDLLTEDFVEELVFENSVMWLMYLPDSAPTDHVVIRLVDEDAAMFRRIPDKRKTLNVCLHVLEKYGSRISEYNEFHDLDCILDYIPDSIMREIVLLELESKVNDELRTFLASRISS